MLIGTTIFAMQHGNLLAVPLGAHFLKERVQFQFLEPVVIQGNGLHVSAIFAAYLGSARLVFKLCTTIDTGFFEFGLLDFLLFHRFIPAKAEILIVFLDSCFHRNDKVIGTFVVISKEFTTEKSQLQH